MLDLLVTTKKQGRKATKFREFLLDEGFEKSQFSVYARFCNGKEQFETYMRRIEANLPDQGDVHILTFTDRQYDNIVRFSGQRRRRKTRSNWPCFDDLSQFLAMRSCRYPIFFNGITAHGD